MIAVSTDVTDTLRNVWEKYGLTSEEIRTESQKLQKDIDAVVEKHIVIVRDLTSTMTEELKDIVAEYALFAKAIGQPGSLHVTCADGVRVQFESASTALVKLVKEQYEPRLRQFEELAQRLTNLYDLLGISESRRNCNVDPADLTPARYAELLDRVRRLESEADHMAAEFRVRKNEVIAETNELGMDLPSWLQEIFEKDDCSCSAMDSLQVFLYDLQEEADSRRVRACHIEAELRELGHILQCDCSQFRYHGITNSEMAALEGELTTMLRLREERLPGLLAGYRRQMEQLCSDLHFTSGQVQEITARIEQGKGDDALAEAYCRELARLKDMYERYAVIVAIMGQRDKLIDDYRALPNDPGEENQTERTKRESLTRRHRVVLPQIERRVKIMLMEFRQANGADFLWDGEPLIRRFHHIKVRAEEVNYQRRKSRMFPAVPVQADHYRRRSAGQIWEVSEKLTTQRKSLE
jgi:hypothetical protein